MTRRELLAGIAAAAIVPPAIAKPTSFLAPGHVSIDPFLLASGYRLMIVPKWVEDELRRSGADQWAQVEWWDDGRIRAWPVE